MVQDVHKQGSQWRSRFSLPPSLLPSFSPLLLLSPHPPSLTLSHFVCQYFVFQGHAQWSGEWQIAGETGLMVPSHSLFPLQPIPQPPKKHASGSPSHLCCTSSSHKCGGYKWRYENRQWFRQQVTETEEMAGQWMMILIGASLWMTCSAAPTECHFNSQGETNLFITRMQMCLETKSFHYQIDCSVQRAQVQYSILITWMSCLLRQSRQPSEIRWCRYNVIWTTCTHCSLERIIWLINAVSYALVISPSTKTNVKALCYLLNASFWKLKVCFSSVLSASTAQCEYEGRHYTLGQTWMEQGCIQCTCLHPFGVGCCETSVVLFCLKELLS